MAWTVDSYTMVYAINCSEAERSPISKVSTGYHKWIRHVPLNEDRTGSWVTDYCYYNVNVVNNTVYDPRIPRDRSVGGARVKSMLAATLSLLLIL